MEKDIFQNDYLSVDLKTDVAEEMIGYYRSFGWEKLEQSDDRRYFDLIHVTFCRPRRIPHKDRLQYLQVTMEAEVNRRNWKHRTKNGGSAVLSMLLSFLATGLLITGLLFGMAGGTWWIRLLGFALSAGIFGGTLIAAYFIKKLMKKENRNYRLYARQTRAALIAIGQEAEALLADDPTGGPTGGPKEGEP